MSDRGTGTAALPSEADIQLISPKEAANDPKRTKFVNGAEFDLLEETRQIQQVSWLLILLASLSVVLALLEFPSVMFLSGRAVVWIALASGIVSGLGAIGCTIYLRRKKLRLPRVTVAALLFAVVLLAWAGFVIYMVIIGLADCFSVPYLVPLAC